MRLSPSSTLCLVLFAQFGVIYGNTEIFNFDSTTSLDVPGLNVSRYSLDLRSLTRLFSLELAPQQTPWSDICDTTNDCPHELLIRLDLEKNNDGRVLENHETPKYSLRISSRPSPPAQFKIEVFTPREAYEIMRGRAGAVGIVQDIQTPPQTRTMYARIRARDAGVQVPQEMTWHLFPPLVAKPSNRVDFHLILDPLLLGFIPKSVVPVIWAVLIAGAFGGWCIRWVRDYLEKLAQLCVPEKTKDGD
ncbi:unnamed protein product [Rhizoctonia solani]|uniref:Uncharacterized protein n=1 Tax=Rhizoctonia solani TaxID=456999 RepID=A0A8H2XPN8_9AGAM|nr:unnamed protein product [Rhizoctonia solani]